jgi:hypothetical protein
VRAAGAGDRAGVESLLAAGAFADAPLPNGETALMRASARGFEDVARALLAAGAHASARRADGFTPLTLAAFFDHAGVVRLLLEHGADASARTRLGTTAEAWADARGFSEISGLLAAATDQRRRAATDPLSAADVSSANGLHAEPGPRPSPPRQPVTGVLLAALAPDTRAGRGREEQPRVSESELRARASEVAELFGPQPSSANVAAESASAVLAASESGGAGLAASPAESVSAGDHTGAELFASLQAARPARAGRSWQSTAGLLLLALGCVVAVYAAWFANRPGRNAAPGVVQPQAAGVQPVSPLPAPAAPTPQPSPGATPFDPQAFAVPGTADPGSFVPYQTAEPVALPPVTPYTGGATSAPAIVNEEGRPAAPDTRREAADSARERRGASEAAGDESSREPALRGGEARGDSSRQAVAPPVYSVPAPAPAPTAAVPLPSPTPGRKVIQWPPS